MRLVIALLIACVSQQSLAVEISNFRSGLACTSTKLTEGGSGWICQPTEEVLITDQGTCVYNSQAKPCTWIGFEFDYKSNSKGTKLHCTVETSAPTNPGNPTKVLSEGVTSHSYEIKLGGESGHFFNPQYYIFTVRQKDDALVVNSGSCKSEGVVVFEYKFNLHFPTDGK